MINKARFGVHRDDGFSLIELITTLAVLVILITIGWPSFQNLVRNLQVSAASNDFLHGIWLARSSAIRLNSTVTMCASKSGTECGGQWEDGWIVFHDKNRSAKLDVGEEVLLVAGQRSERVRICGNHLVKRSVSYRSSGISRTAGGALQMGTITVLYDDEPMRQVVLNLVGRPRVARENLSQQISCEKKH